MSQNGKGDKSRPMEVPWDVFAHNWDQIFPKKCVKCNNTGWVWAHELDEYTGTDPLLDDTKYSCDACSN